MAYRDRPIDCPRCAVMLTRVDTDDRWSCAACRGALVGIEALAHELVAAAPELLPPGNVRDVTTIGRRSSDTPLTCPVCASPMAPVFLGGIELDRCDGDAMLWFDGGEHARVMDVARHARDERSLRQRIVDALLGRHWPT